jgi:choice-of-anchor C domain-containing protein
MSMRGRVLSAAIAISLCAAYPASAGVNLIQNGSFELGNFDSAPFDTLGAGSTAMTAWTIGGDSIDWIGSYWQPGDGSRSVDLSGNALGSVSQSFSTVTGQKYTVSFLLAGNPDGPPQTKDVDVSVNGASQDFLFPTVLGSATRDSMNWTPISFIFTANTALETLTFASATCGGDISNNCAFGPALDAVSVTSAVPELSTWGMMLLGFAGVGFVAYRRARSASSIGIAA